MPNITNPSNGPFGATAIMPVRFQDLTFTFAGEIQTTQDLLSDGLPGLRIYTFVVAGPGTVSVLPQFANGSDGAGNIQWRPLSAPYAVAGGVPTIVPITLGSRRYRVVYTATAACVVVHRIVGTLT